MCCNKDTEEVRAALYSVADSILQLYVVLSKSNMVAEVTGNMLQVTGNSSTVTCNCSSVTSVNGYSKSHSCKTKSGTRKELHPDAEPLAKYLAEKIRERSPKAKVPTSFARWAEHMDKLLRIDKRDKREVMDVIDWVTGHHFWASNILSARKLRDKFDMLVLRMESESNPRCNTPKPVYKQPRLHPLYAKMLEERESAGKGHGGSGEDGDE